MAEVRALSSEEARRRVPELAVILLECVEGGASVSFMPDLNQAEAERFYHGCVDKLAQGNRALLGAFDEGRLVGTVQVVFDMPPNQPHRGEIAKLLVRPGARGQGLAKSLMKEAERIALENGKSLLVLDTVTGSPADALYESLGWTRLGSIPNFALYPNGEFCAATYFYKHLGV